MSNIFFLPLAVYLDKIQMKSNGSQAKYSYGTEKSGEDDRFTARETPVVRLNVL